MDEVWITTQEAVALSGYDLQHVRWLARKQKINSRKFGVVWQINKPSLISYINDAKKSADNRRGPKQ